MSKLSLNSNLLLNIRPALARPALQTTTAAEKAALEVPLEEEMQSGIQSMHF